MAYQTSRIEGYSLVADPLPVDHGKRSTKTVDRRRLPFVLIKPTLNLLGSDAFRVPSAELDFESLDAVLLGSAVPSVVPLTVLQSVIRQVGETDRPGPQPLR